MKVIRAENVNYALPQGLRYLLREGVTEQSRNGPVLVAPKPVCTVYANPTQRVLFSADRDANPFFHLMESLWMLAGRNDVRFVKYYAGNMGQYSDDGETLHGAYGYRWREAIGHDQLNVIIEELRRNPETRRCVLQMWDASQLDDDKCSGSLYGQNDLLIAVSGGKDVPCNTHAYFMVRNGHLDMTVCCRSNDVVWGAYGANAVHFSMLQEYIARSASLKVGVYRQVSNNYHVYSEREDVKKLMFLVEHSALHPMDEKGYHTEDVSPYPIMENGQQGRWDTDMYKFFELWREGGFVNSAYFHDPFWRDVVAHMANAHHHYKAHDFYSAMHVMEHVKATDWKLAGQQWLQRRLEKRHAK